MTANPVGTEQSEVVCPFCGEGDFDLLGLKMHLLGSGFFSGEPHCPPFAALASLTKPGTGK